jgi:hypothetical protein
MTNFFTAQQGKFPLIFRLILICFAFLAASASGLIIAGNPQVVYFILIALAALAGLLIISRWAALGLLLSIFLFVVQRSPDLPIVGNLLTISEPFLLIALFVWLAQNARSHHKVALYAPGLLGPFLIYIVVAFISLLNSFASADIVLGVAEIFARFYLMFFLVIIASYATSASRYNHVLLAWVASAAFVAVLTAVYLIYKVAGLGLIRFMSSGDKFIALFRNPNALAGYITGTFLGFLPLALSQRSLRAFPQVQRLARYSLPGLLVALVFADSQGAYLAVAAGVLAWPYFSGPKRLRPIWVISFLVVLSIAVGSTLGFQAPGALFNRALTSIGFEQRRIPERLALFSGQLQMVSDHLITGVGIGQAGPYAAALAGSDEGTGSHLTPLGIFAEVGLLGILAVSMILVALLAIIRENMRLNPARDSGWRQLNEGLIIAFIGMLVFSLTHDVQTNRTMWLIMALLVSLKPAFLSTTSTQNPGPDQEPNNSNSITDQRRI